MRHSILIMILATSVGLVGCFAAGVKVDQATLSDLQPGATPCAQIVQRYGQPTGSAINADGTRTLSYGYQQVQAKPENFVPIVGSLLGGASIESTAVVFQCDAQGILTTYSSTQGQAQSGYGLISGGKQK